MTAALAVVWTAFLTTAVACALLVLLGGVRGRVSYALYMRLVGVCVFLGGVGFVALFVGLAFLIGGVR